MTGVTNFSPSEETSRTGKRVFISYRAQEPDQSLAKAFHDRLKAANHEPFMAAESIVWGENWVNRIDQELRRCDYFLLLLSEQSVTSDMVAGEVRIAKQLKMDMQNISFTAIWINFTIQKIVRKGPYHMYYLYEKC